MKDKRRFRAYWGSGYYVKGIRIVDIDFFNDTGYNEENKKMIDEMSVGQKLDFSTNWSTHSVKRIK